MMTSSTRTIKQSILRVDRETVVSVWQLPFEGNPDENVSIVSDTVKDKTRWSVIYELIVSIDDKYYQTTYSVGCTEMQDERPWENEEVVEFIEVEKKYKVVEVWEPVRHTAKSRTTTVSADLLVQ